jgi:septal ring factor EnvC (AmiA/AmiB activator)
MSEWRGMKQTQIHSCEFASKATNLFNLIHSLKSSSREKEENKERRKANEERRAGHSTAVPKN